MCSDSEKNMSAYVDQNHATSLTCLRFEGQEVRLLAHIIDNTNEKSY